MSEHFNYPVARKDEDAVEVVHDVTIKDPYWWLNNPDLQERNEFIQLQNKLAKSLLGDEEIRKKVHENFQSVWNYEKWDCPVRYGGNIFVTKKCGKNQQGVYYRFAAEGKESKIDLKKVFDPNSLTDDGSLYVYKKSVSENGQYLAYGLSEAGAPCMKIHTQNVENNDAIDVVLENADFLDIEWTNDSKGFFYGRLEGDMTGNSDEAEPKEYRKLYYHFLGKEQKEDVLICAFPKNPYWHMKIEKSDCGRFLFISILREVDNILYYVEIEKGNITEKPDLHAIVNQFDGTHYDCITTDGFILYVATNYKAPKYCVMKIDLVDPGEKNWSILIPEHEKDILDMVECVDKNKLVLVYMRNAMSALVVHSLVTGERLCELELEIGAVVSLSGNRKFSEIFYCFSTFIRPDTIFRYDFAKPENKPKILFDVDLSLPDFDPDDYHVEQKLIESKDKTMIPIFIVSKKRANITPRPCLMTGYGGFGVSIIPQFGATVLMFIHSFDGVFAMPTLRGGGEFGNKWHDAGRLLNKQNVFNDFQASAEFLIKNKYTTKDRLAIQGAEHGGLVVAACINQRPDLFGTAMIQIGLLDVLRIPHFADSIAYHTEFGSILEREQFESMYKYSPMENVHTPKSAEEAYPATLLVASDPHMNVPVVHTLKFVATLQEAVRKSKFQKKPIIMHIYRGVNAPDINACIMEEAEDMFLFLLKYLNIDTLKL